LVTRSSLDGNDPSQPDHRLFNNQNFTAASTRQTTPQITMSNLLAITHHLFVFGLISTIFGVYTVLKIDAWKEQNRFIKILNRWTLGLTIGALVVGFSRAVWFEKPFTHYADHPFFWIKIASVLAILFLSLRIEAIFRVLTTENQARKVYRLTFIQMHVFPIALICAVLMSRGF
jgi:uncharacterized membrane protein